MPGPIIGKPEIPYWADPKNASVFDVPGQGLLRKVVGLLGLDDPSQVMALGVPLETGAMSGGMLDALAQKFPRFANAIKAYHGSPHDFEKFDVSKIGTGEGAQAYGRGLYFAEGEGVAKSYRDRLSAIPKHVATPESIMQYAVKESGSHERAADFVEQQVKAVQELRGLRQEVRRYISHPQFSRAEFDRLSEPMYAAENLVHQIPGLASGVSEDVAEGVLPQLTQAAERLRRGELPPKGHMYEVAIKADPAHFLDWDKPLSEQSSQVQQAVQRMRESGVLGDETGAATTGEQLMRSKSVLAPEHNLQRFGVPGIKYLDQGSRAAGEGSRNFVVFDDKTVEILKKYGILLPAAGAIQQTQSGQQQ